MLKKTIKFTLIIISLFICSCAIKQDQQKPEVLIDLPSLLCLNDDMSSPQVKEALENAYEHNYIIGYQASCRTPGFDFYVDRIPHEYYLDGADTLAVCIPCKEGSFTLDELKDLLKQYGMTQPLNRRTHEISYKPYVSLPSVSLSLPGYLGKEFSIYCSDPLSNELNRVFDDYNVPLEEQYNYYTSCGTYEYEICKKGKFLFLIFKVGFEPIPVFLQFTETDNSKSSFSRPVKGWDYVKHKYFHVEFW